MTLGNGVFLAVAFPADQFESFNQRVVRDLHGMRRGVVANVGQHLRHAGPPRPEAKTVSLYAPASGYVDLRGRTEATNVIEALTETVPERLLTVLGSACARQRIDLVGGAKGTQTLEKMVDAQRIGGVLQASGRVAVMDVRTPIVSRRNRRVERNFEMGC